jgi:hypothetical protein
MNEEQVRQIIRDELRDFLPTDRYAFQKKIQIFDGAHIQVGRNKGTKIGTETTQKLSVFNATPVVQATAITAPSGGGTIDSQARTAINSLITVLKDFGITA